MKRAGEECGMRGQWLDHPFDCHPEVRAIDDQYQALVGDYQEAGEHHDDYTVNIELSITANSPEEAAELTLADLRDPELASLDMEVSCSKGRRTVKLDTWKAPEMENF